MSAYIIEYHASVLKEDVPKLSKTILLRIQKAITDKLQTNPSIFGKPLRSPLQGYIKLRVGDYRIVFKLRGHTIHILAIAHRKKVYSMVHKR